MRKIGVLLGGCFVVAVLGGTCVGCNGDQNMSTAGTETQTKDTAAMPQQGQGGAKAKHGGGMMPEAETAAPGEKTGIPK
jgi:hypothetical protein